MPGLLKVKKRNIYSVSYQVYIRLLSFYLADTYAILVLTDKQNEAARHTERHGTQWIAM